MWTKHQPGKLLNTVSKFLTLSLTEKERVVERREQGAGADGNCRRHDRDSFTATTQSDH